MTKETGVDCKERILVVDDNRTNILVLVRALQKAGYETLEAPDGFQAVDLARDQLPDLILLDVMMPRRDGLEVCEILKSQQETAPIPIIFVTARTESEQIVSAFVAGGCDYIPKPVRVGEMLARVSVHLKLRRAERELVDKNDQLAGLAGKLAEINTELAHQARIDPLTQLLNRGAWDETATAEHERAMRHNLAYGVVMLDIDYFKAFNDSLGHPAGDECLRRISQCIATTCRSFDHAGRYGGEEFVILAPHTKTSDVIELAERLREAIWELAIAHPSSPAGRVTASLGVAGNHKDSLEITLKEADKALYKAKSGGRNLVCAASSVSSQVPVVQQSLAAGNHSAIDTRAKVLVVDDNRTNMAVYVGCLEKEGYLVQEACDGHAALRAVAKDQPDIILMDVKMPEMDGLECTRILKSDPRTNGIPIIIASSCSEAADIVAGLEAGADEYLARPFRTTELIVRVGSMARLQRDRKDLLRSYQLRAEQIRMLVLLLDFCRSLGITSELEDILELVAATVGEVCGCRNISIMLPDNATRQLCVAKFGHRDSKATDAVSVTFGEGAIGRAHQSQQLILVNDEADSQEHCGTSDLALLGSFPSFACPMSGDGDVVAVLSATDRIGGDPFSPRELEYIELICSIAGPRIHGVLSRRASDEARDLTLVALAKLAEQRDSNMEHHVDRVAKYALLIAKELRAVESLREQIDDNFLHRLEYAVPIHDIGKLAIPDAILSKPGRLTVEEIAVMRTHADIGAVTLRRVMERAPEAGFLQMATEIVQSHHEWYDGTGYPKGIAGDAIPLAAQITALADVYDAMTTRRIYKDAISHDEAAKTIKGLSGTQFAPDIVDAFFACEAEFQAISDEAQVSCVPSEPAGCV